VSQRALTLPDIAHLPPPGLPGRSAGPAPQPAKRFEIEPLPESITADGSCLKGAGFALVFEVVTALCIYGGWLLWKVLR